MRSAKLNSSRRRSTIAAIITLWSVSLSAALLAGCDQSPPSAPAPAPPETAAPSTAPAAPTADDLLRGEQLSVPLKSIPFSISVPKGWSVTSRAGLLYVEGPTMAGSAQLQIARHASPIAQHAERLIEGSKKELAAEPNPLNRAEVRKSGNVQIFDYRKLGKPTGAPAIDSTGKVIAPAGTRLTWKITAFVPSNRGGAVLPTGATAKDGDVDLCELSFVDLTREQYEIDKELLEKIIASLKYDPSAAAN